MIQQALLDEIQSLRERLNRLESQEIRGPTVPASQWGIAPGRSSSANTTSLQRAFTSMQGIDGGTLQLPAGTIALDPVSWVPTGLELGKLRLTGMGKGVTRIIPSAAPVMSFGVAGLNMDALELRDFSFFLNRDLWWDRGLIHVILTRGMRMVNIELVGGPTLPQQDLYSGYLLQMDTSYNSVIEQIGCRGRYTYLFEMDDPTPPVAQMDSVRFVRPQPNSFLGGICRAASDLHTVVVEQIKHVVNYSNGTSGDTDQADETTLTDAIGAGVISLPVASSAAFEPGDPVLIGWSGTIELNRVSSLPDATHISLAHPTRYAHTADVVLGFEPVLHGGVALALAASVRDTVIREPHFERGVVGVLNSGAVHTVVENPYHASRELVRCISMNGSQELTVRGGVYAGNSSVNRIVRVSADAAATSARLLLDGPFTKSTGGAVVDIVPYLQDALADRPREMRRFQRAGASQMADEVWFTTATTEKLLRYINTNGAAKFEIWGDGTVTIAGPILLNGSIQRGIYIGDGSPEGVVTAAQGSLYIQQDPSGGSLALWSKTAGTLAVNWRPIQPVWNGNTASRPTSATIGQSYFDTTLNRQLIWNGVSWDQGPPASLDEPSTTTFTKDDFLIGTATSGSIGEMGWTSGGWNTVASVNGGTGRPGCMRLSAPATSGTVCFLQAKEAVSTGMSTSDAYELTFILRPAPTSTMVNADWRVGLLSNPAVAATGAGATNGVFAEYGAADANWQITYRNASAQVSRVDTGVAIPTANTFVRIKIRRISSTSIGFTLGSAAEVVVTVSAVAGIAVMPCIQVVPGENVAKVLDLDYVSVKVTGLSR